MLLRDYFDVRYISEDIKSLNFYISLKENYYGFRMKDEPNDPEIRIACHILNMSF